MGNNIEEQDELERLIAESNSDMNGEMEEFYNDTYSENNKENSLAIENLDIDKGEEVLYFLDSSDKLTIKDTKRFINLLSSSSAEDSEEYYNVLKKYALKQMANFDTKGIASNDYTHIIDLAITKAMVNYDSNFNNSFLSYFYTKIQGEITAYKTRSFASDRKILKYANEGDVDYAYQKSMETNSNELIAVDFEHIGNNIGEDDLYKRQMKAFKMAFSGIPMELQQIIELIASGHKIKAVAKLLNKDEFYISKCRNQALALILQRIMRSKHLTEEEKIASLDADRKITNVKNVKKGSAIYKIEDEELDEEDGVNENDENEIKETY